MKTEEEGRVHKGPKNHEERPALCSPLFLVVAPHFWLLLPISGGNPSLPLDTGSLAPQDQLLLGRGRGGDKSTQTTAHTHTCRSSVASRPQHRHMG